MKKEEREKDMSDLEQLWKSKLEAERLNSNEVKEEEKINSSNEKLKEQEKEKEETPSIEDPEEIPVENFSLCNMPMPNSDDLTQALSVASEISNRGGQTVAEVSQSVGIIRENAEDKAKVLETVRDENNQVRLHIQTVGTNTFYYTLNNPKKVAGGFLLVGAFSFFGYKMISNSSLVNALPKEEITRRTFKLFGRVVWESISTKQIKF